MRQTLEGFQAIARTVAMCRPQVVAAYPITPQTHIVENISKLVADGVLNCELVSVESEFSAASVVLGAAAAGARAYTASASQGILLMSEVLFNIAGLRIPLVLTCANRAVGAPLSIWNDQQDSMSVRDAGWIQLYCADNQEAVDTTVQAFRIAEQCELPVMVCVDGFTLTHTLEPIDLPEPQMVDSYLPPYKFARSMDPRQPISVGTLVSPDHYTEARHSHHQALLNARQVIIDCDQGWQELSGRHSGGLFEIYGSSSAKVGILALGSVVGTLRDAHREHAERDNVQIVKLRSLRPFPGEELLAALSHLDALVVVERALSPGGGGIVGSEIRAAFHHGGSKVRIHNVALGLGGRDIPLSIFDRILELAGRKDAEAFTILDAQPHKLPPEDR